VEDIKLQVFVINKSPILSFSKSQSSTSFSSKLIKMAPNLSIYAIPVYWVMAMWPHAYAVRPAPPPDSLHFMHSMFMSNLQLH
jgi:hypothetical protein